MARGWWRDDDTLSRWLARHAAERPNAAALHLGGTVLTWSALQERVLRVAEGLRARGLEAGPQFAELERLAPLAATHPEPDARDPFLLLYTSGTTAAPKGVVHAYRTMLGNSRLGVREHALSATDRILCAAPLSHLYGLY